MSFYVFLHGTGAVSAKLYPPPISNNSNCNNKVVLTNLKGTYEKVSSDTENRLCVFRTFGASQKADYIPVVPSTGQLELQQSSETDTGMCGMQDYN